ncbi:hypothetical protein [Streptomyces sp. NPDC096068]|uniref:hypothetical protein n=1 Tax=Streptomyces sp. NPDC096068 TaxID=3155424 RepID=UPI00332129B4
MSAVDHSGHERHELLGHRVRDIASGGEGELMAVTHEVHDDGRVVRVAHIRPVSGVEWSAAAANVQAVVRVDASPPSPVSLLPAPS